MSTERPVNITGDRRVSQERHEIDPTTSARWFAGALEAGGSVGFGIQTRKNGHRAAYPFLTFRESKEIFNESLLKRFGGGVYRRGRNSLEWRITGYKAAEIVADMEPYVVSRKEVTAMKNWLNADTAERVQTAEEMKGYDRYQDGSVDEYERLMRDPMFVAGVLDYKGTIYGHHDKQYIYPRVTIRSKNRNLLSALQSHYGGEVSIALEAGTESAIGDYTFQTKKDSYEWTSIGAGARELIRSVLPHVIVPPYEGWGSQLIKTVRQKRSNEATDVRDFVQDELEKFARGEISKLSTVEELAKKFSLRDRTLMRRLGTLPEDARKRRATIIKTANQRLLTEENVRSLVALMTQELEEYLQGKRKKLRYNDKWAKQADVGVHIIDRNVIPLLPKDVQEQRQHLLYSQAAKERNEKYGNPGKNK